MNDYLELRDLLSMLWRRKWLLLLITVFAAVGAYVTSRVTSPVYEASTTLLIDQAPALSAAEYSAIIASDRGARTYAELLTKRPVINETLTRLGQSSNSSEIIDITVELVPDTQLIELKVEHANPILASLIANTIVDVFIEQNDAFQASRFAASKASLSTQLDKINEQIQANEAAIISLGTPPDETGSPEFLRLQAELTQNQVSYISVLQSYEELRIAEAQSVSNLLQVEPAEPPGSPVRPRILLNTLVAGAAGAFLAVGAVFLIEQLDDTLKTPQDVSGAMQLPVIGHVASSKKLRAFGTRQSLMISEPNSEVAEAFRSIRTNLELAGPTGFPRSILITSLGKGDGKTTIAAQLAMSMAQGGKKIILVDANLRRPSLHEYLGTENTLGLSDMLVDDLVPQVVAQETIHWRLKVITSGKPAENLVELMGSPWMLKSLARLREQADAVIFDGPPLLVSESYVLASRIEGTLVVVQYGRTRGTELKPAIDHLDRAQANVLGIVMNRAPTQSALGSIGTSSYGLKTRASSAGTSQPSKASREVAFHDQAEELEDAVEHTGVNPEVRS